MYQTFFHDSFERLMMSLIKYYNIYTFEYKVVENTVNGTIDELQKKLKIKLMENKTSGIMEQRERERERRE